MKTLKDLTKNRIYRIPDYQRGYSWEEKHIYELIDDIDNIRLENDLSYHFTGILSYSAVELEAFNKKENLSLTTENEIEIFHITDGQQRLTTLFILLFELNKKLFPEDFASRFLEKTLTINIDGKTIYKFGYDVDVPSREHLYNVIFEDNSYEITHPETLYTSNLDFAKSTIKKFIEDWDDNALKRLKRKLENRLLFQEFIIDTAKLDVSMVFETMNYRGKGLSRLELFKNRLIYLIGARYFNVDVALQNRKLITDAWLRVYSWLGKRSETKLNDDLFLMAFITMHYDNSLTVDSDFKRLIERLFKTDYPIKSYHENTNLSEDNLLKLANSIELAVKCYYVIHNPFSKEPELDQLQIPKQVKNQLFVLNQIGGANYMKTLICAALARFIKVGHQEQSEFLALLREIEKHQMLVFNFLGRKNDANRPDVYRLCYDLYEGKSSFQSVKIKLKELILKWWRQKNRVDMILDRLNSTDKRFLDLGGLKVLLFLKEIHVESLQDHIKKINDFKLDLIFPESHGSNARFPNVVRTRDPRSNDVLRYSLGNIVILENNLSESLNPIHHSYFQDRKSKLVKSSNLRCREIALKIESWSDSDILNRGFEILNFIQDRYNISELDDREIKQILVDNLVIQQSVN